MSKTLHGKKGGKKERKEKGKGKHRAGEHQKSTSQHGQCNANGILIQGQGPVT
jgi:hypothetical protein